MEFTVTPEGWELIHKSRIDRVFNDLDRIQRLAYCGWRLSARAQLRALSDPTLRYTPESFIAVAIQSYGDGLHASARLWQASDRRTFPTASGTLMRQSMFAAASGLWLLVPDDDETRRERFSLAAVGAIRNAIRADQCVVDNAPRGADTAAIQQKIAKSKAAVAKIRADYGLGKANGPLDTTVWDEAATVTYPDSVRDVGRLRLWWRVLSGDAHSLVWVPELRARLRGDPGTPDPIDEDRVGYRAMLDTDDYAAFVEDAVAMGPVLLRLAIRRGMRPVARGLRG
jgi:hypothetical protein